MFLRDKQQLLKAKNDDAYLNSLLQNEEAIKFIKFVIKGYTKSPTKFMAVNKVEWEDLLQAAYIGLFKAIKNVNLELSPNEWVRYSYLTIQGEIRNFSRSNDSNMVVISQRIREMYPKYRNFHEEFWVEHAKDPTIEDTMKHFHISKNDAFDLVYGMQEVIYQEDKVKSKSSKGDNSIAYTDTIAFMEWSPRKSVEGEALNNIMVENIINYINETQRKVIYLHYFKGLNKTEISKIIGCSTSMVSKHILTAFKNIRQSEVLSS
ncbi:sigma-70 family RNA polymerase sigma factor [Alteribacillus sp. YIM 98480]|uniref:sigma-70 family RNA polymerase sigma factor n=1 Tax=Alteribacillus sp. YIM 98480 TaxID=2606599 RepID=UPI00131BFA45|nr:sigma-70 family RNA polymerase sigma factor [Alteribacillus sp. YIM 98480]